VLEPNRTDVHKTAKQTFTKTELLEKTQRHRGGIQYALVEKLGSGGFGTVFRAKDTDPPRDVALKVLNPDRLTSSAAVSRFEQEMQTLAGIECEGVVRLYHHGRFGDDGPRFLVMQFVPGGSLRDLIRTNPQGIEMIKATRMIQAVADSLHHVHRKGAAQQALIHCDLKPENILLDREGNPHLADFGLAAAAGDLFEHQAPVGGTLPYASPEQNRRMRGRGGNVDTRSDVWSLGVVLFELLTGRRPFRGSDDEIAEAIERDEPTAPKDLNIDIPEALDDVIRTCLRKNPNDRFQTAADLAEKLRPWAEASVECTCLLPEKNRFFTGRETILSTVADQLKGYRVAIITGLGGAGKTQVAVEYAHRHRAEYTHVFWVRADSADILETGLVDVAAALALPEARTADRIKMVHAVRDWLGKHKGWLIVLDDAEDSSLVRPYLPREWPGCVLITSQISNWDSLGVVNPVRLNTFADGESLEFLIRRTGRDRLDAVERGAAVKLAHELGNLPLALELAAAYITSTPATFSDYLTSYRRHPRKVLGGAKPRMGDYPHQIETTWALNFKQVEKESPASADLLQLSAFLYPDRVSEELLTFGQAGLTDHLKTALADVGEFPNALNELLKPLVRYSLIQRDLTDRSYSLHILVQKVLRWNLGQEDQRDWIERAATAAYAATETHPLATHLIRGLRPDMWRRLLPQIKQILQYAEERGVVTWAIADLNICTALFLCQCGYIEDGMRLCRRSFDVMERVAGKEKDQVVDTFRDFIQQMTNVDLIQQMTKVARACGFTGVPLESVAEEAGKNVCPTVSPLFVGQTLLSLFLRNGSCELGRTAVKELLETDHPEGFRLLLSVLTVMCPIDYEPARIDQLLQEWTSWARRTVGPNHPALAGMENIHRLVRQGLEFDKNMAETLLKKAESTMGPEDPSLAEFLSDVVSVSKPADAESLCRRYLAVYDESNEANHSMRALTLLNLARTVSRQDRREEARELQQKAVSAFEKVYGDDHQEVAICLIRIASDLARHDSDYRQADRYLQRAHSILVKGSGNGDLRALCNYVWADLNLKMGLPNMALLNIERSLDIHEKLHFLGFHGGIQAAKTILDYFVVTRDIANFKRLFEKALTVISAQMNADLGVFGNGSNRPGPG
jgi:serine/threonine protein kinase/tetratricopeptide (TPR) repeat protein